MYGGHITDAKDRRLCASYLVSYIREELLDQLAFFPKFEVPPSTFSHKQYVEYIEEKLATETPAAYGLHANSEINFMTMQAEALFAAVAELQPREGGGVSGGVSLQERVKRILDEIVDKLPELFPVRAGVGGGVGARVRAGVGACVGAGVGVGVAVGVRARARVLTC